MHNHYEVEVYPRDIYFYMVYTHAPGYRQHTQVHSTLLLILSRLLQMVMSREGLLQYSVCMNIFAYHFLISLLSNQHSVAATIIIISSILAAVILSVHPTTLNIFSKYRLSYKRNEVEYSMKDLELINKFNLQLFGLKNRWYGGPNIILYIDNNTNCNKELTSSSELTTIPQTRSKKLMEMQGFIAAKDSSVGKRSSVTDETTSDTTST